MKITCPVCHQVCEVPFKVAEGQHLRCPYCNVKFSYGRSGSIVLAEVKKTSEVTDVKHGKRHLLGWSIFLIVVASIWGCVYEVAPDRLFSPFHEVTWSATRGSFGATDGVFVKFVSYAIREQVKSVYHEGSMIFIDKDEKIVSILEPVSWSESTGSGKLRQISQYDISDKEQWNKFKFEVSVILNPTPASEIISYVRSFK